jgi:hypothetical protein
VRHIEIASCAEEGERSCSSHLKTKTSDFGFDDPQLLEEEEETLRRANNKGKHL